MLLQLYEYAASRREELLRGVVGPVPELTKAKSLWRSYEPRRREGLRVAGIDSSWNFIAYLGFYLYAVDAVCMTAKGEHVARSRYHLGMGELAFREGDRKVHNPRLVLEGMGLAFERELALEASGSLDYVLLDGSIMARYYEARTRTLVDLREARELLSRGNVIFISKRSDSNSMLGGRFGDIHYFDAATSATGYSEPRYDEELGVSIAYVRLARGAPVLRVEIPGEPGDREIMELLDALSANSVDGYPVQLRIAHETCKITREDMDRLADILGLGPERGGREVLGE